MSQENPTIAFVPFPLNETCYREIRRHVGRYLARTADERDPARRGMRNLQTRVGTPSDPLSGSQMPAHAAPPGRRRKVMNINEMVDSTHEFAPRTPALIPSPPSPLFLRDSLALPIHKNTQFSNALRSAPSNAAVAPSTSHSHKPVTGSPAHQPTSLLGIESEHASSRSSPLGAIEQARRGSTRAQRSSRKGMRWSSKESDLLLKLRKDEKRCWAEVTRLFSEEYPGRSQSAIQVYWSTTLSKKED